MVFTRLMYGALFMSGSFCMRIAHAKLQAGIISVSAVRSHAQLPLFIKCCPLVSYALFPFLLIALDD